MSDPTLPAELAELRDRVSAFVREIVIPAEAELGLGAPSEELRSSLQRQAADAGVFAPHVPEEYGGLGLGMFEQSVVFEAAGYSLLGPLALNCAAPDEGNMHLLHVIATDEQKARYLTPLAGSAVPTSFGVLSSPTMSGSGRTSSA